MDAWLPLAVAFPFAAILMLGGVWANQRFAGYKTLPVHFNFRLEADRMASRGLAIWLLPVMFSIMLLGIGYFSSISPREGQNADPVPWMLFTGVVLVASQVFVLWLMERWARSQ